MDTRHAPRSRNRVTAVTANNAMCHTFAVTLLAQAWSDFQLVVPAFVTV